MLSRFSRVWLGVTLWNVACQAPLSMGFSRQEYWSELPSSSPGDLPDPGIELRSPALQADYLLSEPQSAPGLVFADCIELLHLWLQIRVQIFVELTDDSLLNYFNSSCKYCFRHNFPLVFVFF